ncbi:Roundabout-like protein 2 [Hypsibius exemplaris]|uniref:Roundabout-like protein 2 n=1 Tax=Hypsibius exemplaris TaxID=2072580 RepID=A0A9X6NCI5_HYPEX|nr:Roundabout-like protein 2 [Hypsibius exemplaris]
MSSGLLFWIFVVLLTAALPHCSHGQPTTVSAASHHSGRPPRILEHPSDLIIPKNEPATLQCKADGEPSPQILWYKDPGELISSSSVGNPLLPSSVSPQLVTGNSNNNEADQSASPRLIQQNGALYFSRVLHNKKGRPDAGMYWCIARNSLGEARSRNATLQVALLRDEFRRQPSLNLQVAAGETALLECQPPRGFPEPKVFWKRDGKELKATGRFALMDEGNLVITEVRASDAGKYICVAENLVGTKESHVAVLSVHVKPSFISPPQDITAIAEDNVVFECKVKGDPEPTVTWRKKDGGRWPLKDNRVSLQDDRSLRIERVSPSDEGVYVCDAENIVGTASTTAILTVHSRPSFLMTPRDQRVAMNGAVSFDCLTTGNPPPAVFWTKEGSQVLMFPGQPHGRYAVQSDGTLLIETVKKEDTGYYVCSALSVAGSSIAKVYLEVSQAAEVPPPVIKIAPANQTLALNSIAMLPCQATDIPPSTIHWIKDGVLLLTTNNPRAMVLDSGTLQISDLQTSDSGIYTCIASSESGETSWSASLMVEAPTNPSVIFHRMPDQATWPSPPSKPQVVNVTETFVEISWRPPLEEGASHVTAYRVEYFSFDIPMGWTAATHDTVSHTRIGIPNLRPDSSYLFLIRAINSHGISLPSVMSEPIRTLGNIRPLPDYDLADIKAKFTQQLVELTEVRAISSTAVNLYWNILRHEKYIGGYFIKFRHGGHGNFSMVTVRRGLAQTHTLLNLRKYTNYEFILVPFYKDIRGVSSNALSCQTSEDVPDEPPQDIDVHLVNLTTITITWQPPSVDHINGRLVDYRILLTPANIGVNHNASTSSSSAAGSVVATRNITVPHRKGETRSELIGNLTVGMRYKVTMAARTEAGLGVMSKAIYIRMEKGVSGTADFLREPWFIGSLGGVLFLLLATFCIMLYLRRSNLSALRRKTYPPLQIQQMGIPFHSGMQTTTSLLPDSSAILGRRPLGTYARNSPWIHTDNQHCEWAGGVGQPGDLKENLLSSFDIPLGAYGPHGDTSASPYATATLAMQKQRYMQEHQQQQQHSSRSCQQHPPLYNDVLDDMNKKVVGHYDNTACQNANNTNSSLSSRSHQSHPETVSVHSQRSSPRSARSISQQQQQQQQKPPTFLPTLNWADILPPPPRHPPPSEMSANPNDDSQDDYSALCYAAEDGQCEKCDSESEEEDPQKQQVPVRSNGEKPQPPPRNPRMVQRAVQERASLERNRDRVPRSFAVAAATQPQLPRTRSFESETSWSASLMVEAPTNPSVIFHRMPDQATWPSPPSKPQVVKSPRPSSKSAGVPRLKKAPPRHRLPR